MWTAMLWALSISLLFYGWFGVVRTLSTNTTPGLPAWFQLLGQHGHGWHSALNWWQRDGERKRWEEGFENGLYTMIGAIRSGSSIIHALEQTTTERNDPWARSLAKALEKYHGGMRWTEAMAGMRNDPRGYQRLFLQVLELQQRAGGNPLPMLSNLVEIVQIRRLEDEEAQVRTLEARWTAGMLAALPLFFLLYMSLTAPDLLMVPFRHEAGRAAIVYAVASWGTGLWLLARMIRGEEGA